MGYAIVCDARKGESLGIGTLALVDRAKTKKLTRNNAHVVSYSDAVNAIAEQAKEISHQEAMMDSEGQGWDAHKDQF